MTDLSDRELLPCPFCGHNPDPNNLVDSLHPRNQYAHWSPEGYFYFNRKPEGSVYEVWEFSCLENEGGCGTTITGNSKVHVVEKWNTRAAAELGKG